MKKVVRIILAILMVACLALSITACKSECDKGNHVWNDGTVTKAATCTEKGVKTYKCTVCDWGSKTESIPTIDHTPIDASVAATCTKAGVSNATKCKDCDASINAGTTIPALGHDFNGVSYTPSPTDANKHDRVCKREGCGYFESANHVASATDPSKCADCGATISVPAPPCEHNYDGAIWTPCPTDSSKHQRMCTVEGCGHIDTAPHGSQDVAAVPATCTTTGRYAYTKCPDCNETIVGSDEVIPATGHSYTDQPWKLDAEDGSHYQECKNGCGTRNSHAEKPGAWVTTDDTNHYKVCQDCTLHLSVGAHNNSTLAKVDDNQHSVKCSVCGKQYANADHTWTLDVDKSQDSTCSVAGKRVETCACGAEKDTPIEKLPHVYAWQSTADGHLRKCSECGNETDQGTHTITLKNTDVNQHWDWCAICKYEDKTTAEDHSYGDDMMCECGRAPENVTVVLYYQNAYTRHDTLVAALNAVTDNDEAVIFLGKDLSGAGIAIPENRNVTIRLNNHTYTVTGGVGEDGELANQALHFDKNSNVSILNGTITTGQNSGISVLVANFANLTTDGVTFNGMVTSHLGTTTLTNTTIKVNGGIGLVAGRSGSTDGVSVTVGAGSTIVGTVQYGGLLDTDGTKVTLVLNDDYTVVFGNRTLTCNNANITIGGQHIAHMTATTWSFDLANKKHYHTCSRCPARVDETSCTETTVTGSAATCTTDGMTDGVKCSVCDNTIVAQETITATGHRYADEYTSISATQHAQKCIRCDATQNLGNHAVSATNPQYVITDDGHTAKCGVCSATFGGEQAHNSNKVVNATAATCTSTGLTEGRNCDVCDKVITAQTSIPKADHTEALQFVSGNKNQHKVVCGVCGAEIRMADHTVTNGKCACGYLATNFDVTDIATIIASVPKSGNVSANEFFAIGIITEQKKTGSHDEWTIKDTNGNIIVVFDLTDINGVRFDDMTVKPAVNDVIVVWSKAKNYNGKEELSDGILVELKGETLVTAPQLLLTKVTISNTTIEGDFDLPTLENYTINWTSSNTDAIAIDNGKAVVTRITTEQQVTLTASLTIDGVTATKEFALTVKDYDPTQPVDVTLQYKDTVTSIDGVSGTNYVENLATDSVFINNFTVTLEQNSGSTFTRLWNDGTIRLYQHTNGTDGGSIQIFANQDAQYIITKIVIKVGSSNNTIEVTDANGNRKYISPSTLETEITVENINSNGVKIQHVGTIKTSANKNIPIFISSITVTYQLDICTHENVTHRDASEADCLNPAMIACDVCDKCGAYLDSNKNEIDPTAEGSTALGHTYNKDTNVGFVAVGSVANCTTPGATVDCYYCTRCNKCFDEHNVEIDSDKITPIDDTKHNYIYSALTGENAGKHQGVCQYNSEHTTAIENHTATVWGNSETEHWQICTLCKVETKFNVGSHTLSDTPCTTCGAVSGEKTFTIKAVVTGGTYSGAVGDVIEIGAKAKVGDEVGFIITIPQKHTLTSVTVDINGVTVSLDDEENGMVMGSFTVTEELLGDATNIQVTVTLEAITTSWKLATVDNLVSGAKVVMASGTNIAGSYASSKFSPITGDLSKDSDETKPFNVSATIFTFEKSGDVWLIKNGTNYIGHNSKTNFKTATSVGATDKAMQWTITFGADGKAKIVNVNDTSRVIMYSTANSKFGPYADNQSGYNYLELYVWC